MARSVEAGAKSVPGIDVTMKYYAGAEELAEVDSIIIGMPTYYHDISAELKKLFEEVAVKEINLSGKVGAAFGSYGWSGEAPHMILEIMKNKFKMEIIQPALLIKYDPDKEGLGECRKLGRTVAEWIMKATLNA